MLRVQDQDADQDELREDELDPEEALVAVGPIEDLLRDPFDPDVRKGEIPRNDAVPERPGSGRPDPTEDQEQDEAERRAPRAQIPASTGSGSGLHSGSGSGGGRSAGLE